MKGFLFTLFLLFICLPTPPARADNRFLQWCVLKWQAARNFFAEDPNKQNPFESSGHGRRVKTKLKHLGELLTAVPEEILIQIKKSTRGEMASFETDLGTIEVSVTDYSPMVTFRVYPKLENTARFKEIRAQTRKQIGGGFVTFPSNRTGLEEVFYEVHYELGTAPLFLDLLFKTPDQS